MQSVVMVVVDWFLARLASLFLLKKLHSTFWLVTRPGHIPVASGRAG